MPLVSIDEVGEYGRKVLPPELHDRLDQRIDWLVPDEDGCCSLEDVEDAFRDSELQAVAVGIKRLVQSAMTVGDDGSEMVEFELMVGNDEPDGDDSAPDDYDIQANTDDERGMNALLTAFWESCELLDIDDDVILPGNEIAKLLSLEHKVERMLAGGVLYCGLEEAEFADHFRSYLNQFWDLNFEGDSENGYFASLFRRQLPCSDRFLSVHLAIIPPGGTLPEARGVRYMTTMHGHLSYHPGLNGEHVDMKTLRLHTEEGGILYTDATTRNLFCPQEDLLIGFYFEIA